MVGWAVIGDAPARAVFVRRGEEVLAAITVGDARPDVAEALGSEDFLGAGFSGSVRLAADGSAEGSLVEIAVDVLDASGTVAGPLARATIRITGLEPAVRGMLELSTITEPLRSPLLVVDGWAIAGIRPARLVTIWCGDVPLGSCAPLLARPDVATDLGVPSPLYCGFMCEVNLLDAVSGGDDVVLRASLEGADGTIEGWLDPVAIDYVGPRSRPRVIGQIDHWKSGDRIGRRPLRVYGWAAIEGGRVAGVVITVNGEVADVVPLGVRRRDLVEATGRQDLLHAGFDATVELDDFEGDRVVVRVTVVAADELAGLLSREHLELAPVTLAIRSAGGKRQRKGAHSAVRGALDVPLDQGVDRGVVNLWGWVLGREAPIDRVELLVEGVSRGFARIGLDRLDVAKRYDQPHAAATGFEHLVDFASFPDEVRRVELAVVAHLLDGEAVEFATASVRLRDRPKPPSRRDEERAETLRERTSRALAATSRARPTSERLRLMAVTHHLGYGGAQLWLSELLARSGAGKTYDCVVVAPSDGPLRSDLERSGVEVHVAGDFPMDSIEKYEGRIAELALWARQWGPNAALVNTALCSMGVDLAKRLGLPCVWAIHESWPPAEFWAVAYGPGQVHPIVLRRAEALFSEADALVFEAEATRQQYLGHAQAERASVVHYGIDVQAIERYLKGTSRDEARAKLGFREDEFVILVMGTVEPRKAQTVVAQAFARVAAAHPHARLVFVGGGDTPYCLAVKDFVERADLGDRIEIQPIVKDTYLRYRAADLFLSASDVESLPRSVVEVMAFSVPVLASSVFGIPELIEHGSTGLLFGPKSLHDAALAIDSALSLPKRELQAIGEAGRRLIAERYDSSGYSTRIFDLVQSLRNEML